MRIENLIGKKNYEKQLEKDSFQYGLPVSMNTQSLKFRNLLQETTDRKASLYKDYKIPLWDKNTYGYDKKTKLFNPNIRALTTINKETGNPEIDFYTPIKDISLAASRNTVGHELGHAKYHIDMKKLNSKLEEAEKNNKNSLIARILKMRKDRLEDNYSKNKESIADKNISKYLKQMGLSKKDRQAHYYLRKSEPPKNEGRYKGKLGNLKYLKDYIFGFSRPLSPEWKDMMRDYCYGVFYLNFSEQGIEKYKEYLDDRIEGLKDWLIEQDPACFKEQKHLDEGSPERIYWHYGELMTLIDLRKGLDDPHSKISQIGH